MNTLSLQLVKILFNSHRLALFAHKNSLKIYLPIIPFRLFIVIIKYRLLIIPNVGGIKLKKFQSSYIKHFYLLLDSYENCPANSPKQGLSYVMHLFGKTFTLSQVI